MVRLIIVRGQNPPIEGPSPQICYTKTGNKNGLGVLLEILALRCTSLWGSLVKENLVK